MLSLCRRWRRRGTCCDGGSTPAPGQWRPALRRAAWCRQEAGSLCQQAASCACRSTRIRGMTGRGSRPSEGLCVCVCVCVCVWCTNGVRSCMVCKLWQDWGVQDGLGLDCSPCSCRPFPACKACCRWVQANNQATVLTQTIAPSPNKHQSTRAVGCERRPITVVPADARWPCDAPVFLEWLRDGHSALSDQW